MNSMLDNLTDVKELEYACQTEILAHDFIQEELSHGV